MGLSDESYSLDKLWLAMSALVESTVTSVLGRSLAALLNDASESLAVFFANERAWIDTSAALAVLMNMSESV